MENSTPFFYYTSRDTYRECPASSGYFEYYTATTAPSPSPSSGPDPKAYDPVNPIYPLPFAPIDSSDPTASAALKDAVKSQMANLPQQCQQPVELTTDDIFTTADKLSAAVGANQVCVKTTYNKATQNSSSLSANAQIDTILASASATVAAQHSESLNEQKNMQSGCASTLINAVNVANKQAQMQCVINNVSQSTSVSLNQNMTLSIITTKTPQEEENLARLNELNANILAKLDTLNTTVFAAAVMAGVSAASLDALSNFQEKMKKLTTDANAAAASIYNRDINLTNVKLAQSANGQLKTSVTLSAAAQTTLAAIASTVSKDVASQAIANTFGTSVLDPNVKQAASTATQNNSSSASSSITNIMNNTALNVSQGGAITISCPGKLTISNSVIDQNFIGSVIANAVLNQAVTNGMTAASSFLSDTQNAQSVANKVAGLNDLQDSLNAGIKGAIDAGNKPVTDAIAAGASKTSYIIYIIVAIAALAILLFLFKYSSKSSGSGGGPLISSDLMKSATDAIKNFKK